ncbi:hypothetical protein KKI24_28860 [bacterium]|nr:hypothetical protein [bacterium]
MAEEKKKKGFLTRLKELSPFSREIGDQEKHTSNGMLQLSQALSALSQYADILDEEPGKDLLKRLPDDRLLQYAEYDLMEEDPLCGQALQIHVSNSLTYDEEAGYTVQVEGKTDENDPIVTDLKNTFYEWQQENSKKILTNVAKYGCWGFRPYFNSKGIDLKKSMVGPECHPASFKIFEVLGEYAGVWSHGFQDPRKNPTLLEAWQFVVFRAPGHKMKTGFKPYRINPNDPNYVFDILDDNPPPTLSESCDYGRSLFQKAYTPWKMVEESLLALLIARLKSAQRETLISYPVSNQDPLEAAQMVRTLTEMLQARDDAENQRSIKEGLVQVARKLILPYDGNGKGQIAYSQAEGNINIEGIQDVMTYIKILCGTLGVDPALMGFSDLMAGGLGEGGWLRTSILSTAFGIMLRQALRNGFERLYDIHVKLRWGKIYTPQQKPWRTKFHSVSDAKQREANDVRSGNMDFGERLINLLLGFEVEGPIFDRKVLLNILATDILHLEEPVVKELTKINGKPTPRTEEKADKFNDMKIEEKVSFIEDALNPYFEMINVH